MLEIQHLNAGYADLHILKDLSLKLQKGKISLLMGPNGAGKSTLLKSIFNLAAVNSGNILYKGKNITGFPAHKLLALGIAFVSQGNINFASLSVLDNLLMGVHFLKNKEEIRRRLEEVYFQFPVLKEKERAYAFSLSGGQQQILALGRALMGRPELLLLDEPSLGLAPKLVREVFGYIKEIKERFGTSILIVEHNIKSLIDVADYGFILVHGELLAEGSCTELKNSDIMKQVFVGALE
ncbi:MAG: ABC transporter ATP-binding protein [Candidatus Magasanikbacteria bacterium]|nr:ABC transporter ATP-binding protein [Candidatus Magasanikbacteria bacterium]